MANPTGRPGGQDRTRRIDFDDARRARDRGAGPMALQGMANPGGRGGKQRSGWDYADIITEGVSRSFRVVLLFFAVVACLFLVRLVFLQVFVAADYSANAEETRTINYPITPRRGTIYDRNGIVLATSVDATTIYCNPQEIEDVDATAIQLAKVMGGVSSDYTEMLSRDDTTFVYIKRQADVDLAEQVRDLELKGVYFIADSRREYPNGAVGGQVIGVCDVDGNGISGLELQYDDILRGTPGVYSAERGQYGTPIPGGVHEDVPAVDGEDILVSLDIKLQDSVEQALAKGVGVYESEKGTSVVMDGDTGEIYAICSYPYLDPTNLSESMVGSDNLTAVTQAFEPGSIFKTVSALAVLESGEIEPDDSIWCPSVIQADGYEVSDAHDRGDASYTFRQILSKSSNVGISLAIERAGFEYLNDVIESGKIIEKTGVDYPGEAAGTMTDFERWGLIIGYNISFGQGITTTPLQMTRFYSAIANGGELVQPHFLMAKPQTGEWVEYGKERVFTDEAALGKLKDMLLDVVNDGTGKDAAIDGFKVAGKTSTAQIAQDGAYAENLYNLCFTGFIDNCSSDLVCFVSVNEVIYEGNVASVFHDIMQSAIDYYNIVPN